MIAQRSTLYLWCLTILAWAGLGVSARAELRTSNLWWLPDCVTTVGQEIDGLFIFITLLTFVVFVAVMVVSIYFMIKYRAKRGVGAIYNHGNNTLEIVWTVIPAAIFMGLVFYSNAMWDRILDEKLIPKNALNVEIVAEQYAFISRYPGAENVLGKADDKLMTMENKLGQDPSDSRNADGFIVNGEFVIPANRAIRLHLRSRDVIHSFYVPEFRLYQDMVPGRTISWLWFEAIKSGKYAIACNQLCGSGHYNMQAKIRILPPDEFEKWYRSKLPATAANATFLSQPETALADGSLK